MDINEHQDWKIEVASYKNGRTFNTLDEMLEPNPGSGRRWRDHDLSIVGPLSGNCYAIERFHDKLGLMYYTAFIVDPDYNHTKLEVSQEHSGSMEDLVSWLQSDEFLRDKISLLVAQGLKPQELPPADAKRVYGSDKTSANWIAHEKFIDRFETWKLSKENLVKNTVVSKAPNQEIATESKIDSPAPSAPKRNYSYEQNSFGF